MAVLTLANEVLPYKTPPPPPPPAQAEPPPAPPPATTKTCISSLSYNSIAAPP